MTDIEAPAIVSTGAEFAFNPTCAGYMLESGVIVNIARSVKNITATFEQEDERGPVMVEVKSGESFYPTMRAVELYAKDAPRYKSLAAYTIDNEGSLDEGISSLAELVKELLSVATP